MNPALTALAVLAVLALVALYEVLAVLCWPYVNCGSCSGSGKRRSTFGGTAFKTCRSCRGSGRKVRAGRRVLDWFRDASRKAKA